MHHEGKSLVALNSMMFCRSAPRNDYSMQNERRDAINRQKIAFASRFMTKAVAVALNPIVALDLIGGAAIDLELF